MSVTAFKTAEAMKALPTSRHEPGLLQSQYRGMGRHMYKNANAAAREYPTAMNMTKYVTNLNALSWEKRK